MRLAMDEVETSVGRGGEDACSEEDVCIEDSRV